MVVVVVVMVVVPKIVFDGFGSNTKFWAKNDLKEPKNFVFGLAMHERH